MASTSYGYKTPKFGRFGSTPYVNSPGANGANYTNGVASALSGQSPLKGATGYGGYGGYTDQRSPQQPSYAPPPDSQTYAPKPPRTQAPPAQAPVAGAYDLNTDPILQQIQALAGQSDQQANANALSQRQQLLVGYGDPNLAASILGQGDPFVQASAQNPTSILASLGHQHDVNLRNYENSLDPSLLYSGARILGLQDQDRAYQEALAQASGQAQGGLDTIAGNLAQALFANQGQRVSGMNDAYQRAIQDALNGGAPTADSVPAQPSTNSSGLNFGGSGLPPTADDLLTALMMARANPSRPVAY